MKHADFEQELSPEVREKMKKNLIYILIFAVVMLFAGLTSGYIVSMGDSFWVKYDFPSDFYISTVLIIVSSFILHFGIRRAQKSNKPGILKFVLPVTFILGLLFAIFQWLGYGQLVQEGAYVSSKIMVSNGRYGTFYELKVNGDFLEVDGNAYKINNKLVADSQKKEISTFAGQLVKLDEKKTISLPDYGKKYTLVYKQQAVTLKNGHFYIQDSIQLGGVDYTRLREMAVHIQDGRGDFFHKGELGKDFHIYYKGKELTYKDRNLYYQGRVLNAPLQLKIENAADTATSYLYLMTVLHLLHIAITLFFMLSFAIRSFSTDLSINNYLSVRVAGIFWHFLGVLWIYLLLFLLFIH